MELWLDTADITAIKKANELGIIVGNIGWFTDRQKKS